MHELSEDMGFMVLDYVCPWHEVNEMEGVFPHFRRTIISQFTLLFRQQNVCVQKCTKINLPLF